MLLREYAENENIDSYLISKYGYLSPLHRNSVTHFVYNSVKTLYRPIYFKLKSFKMHLIQIYLFSFSKSVSNPDICHASLKRNKFMKHHVYFKYIEQSP
jgi:hypothetical protein